MQRRQTLTKSDPRDEILLEEARQLRELAGFMRPGMSQVLMQRARQGEDAARRRTASTPDRYSR